LKILPESWRGGSFFSTMSRGILVSDVAQADHPVPFGPAALVVAVIGEIGMEPVPGDDFARLAGGGTSFIPPRLYSSIGRWT
jgi:hypothetical protein